MLASAIEPLSLFLINAAVPTALNIIPELKLAVAEKHIC